MGGEKDKGSKGERMRDWDSCDGEGRQGGQGVILIEGVISCLARNLALGKFSGIHKNDPN